VDIATIIVHVKAYINRNSHLDRVFPADKLHTHFCMCINTTTTQ